MSKKDIIKFLSGLDGQILDGKICRHGLQEGFFLLPTLIVKRKVLDGKWRSLAFHIFNFSIGLRIYGI